MRTHSTKGSADPWRRGLSRCVWALAVTGALLGGCGTLTVAQRNVVAAAAVGSVVPNANLDQIYYLGSFDPHSQLPPSLYRIRVRGQSSILSQMRFASSWAPAAVVDSLSGNVEMDIKSGRVTTTGGEGKGLGDGRGLMLFGPEGFRPAPRDHRLVVIMGSSPEAVEQAFSSALGTVARVRFGQPSGALDRRLFEHLTELGQERRELEALVPKS